MQIRRGAFVVPRQEADLRRAHCKNHDRVPGLKQLLGGEKLQYRSQHLIYRSVGTFSIRLAMNLWCQWRLIRIVNPGEVSKLTGTCPSIKAFWVSVFANVQWCIHINLNKAASQLADLIANRAIRRNSRNQNNNTVTSKQVCDEPDPSDVFVAIMLAET
jgi:hypothetical protein